MLRKLYHRDRDAGNVSDSDDIPGSPLLSSTWLEKSINNHLLGVISKTEICKTMRSRSRSRSPCARSGRDDGLAGEAATWPIAEWAKHFLSAAGAQEAEFQASLQSPLAFRLAVLKEICT